MPSQAFMTVGEVASELEMTSSGVYKLIQRGKLKAVRKSERNTLVPVPALRAYQARLAGEGPAIAMPGFEGSLADAQAAFERDAGAAPADWIAAWKRGDFEDTPENMRLAIRGLALLAATSTEAEQPEDASTRATGGIDALV